MLPAFSATATAGGFYIKEQSGEGLGRAFAGMTASPSDASIVFFNPAGMTQFDTLTVTANAYALFLDSTQRNRGTTRTVPGVPGTVPVAGGDGGNPFDQPIPVGNFYVASPVEDRNLWVGLGVNSPFGINNKYKSGFFGRYDSRKSLLFTMNIQPSIAYRFSSDFSIGAGFDIQYGDVTLTNALPNLALDLPDGVFRVEGDDWALGWNVGVHWDLGEVEIGAHYRSAIEYILRGELEIRGLFGPLLPLNQFVGVEAPLNLPDIVRASLVYRPSDEPFRIMTDIAWFNWSNFEVIRIQTSAGDIFSTAQNYRNTWSVALGGEYDWGERTTLRLGMQYDETPTRDFFRSTRVPDGDRWWAAAGATYDLSDRYSVAVSYAHVFVTDEQINVVQPFYEATPVQVNVNTLSTNRGSADIVAASVTARF